MRLRVVQPATDFAGGAPPEPRANDRTQQIRVLAVEADRRETSWGGKGAK